MNQSSHYGFWVVHILGNVGSIPKNVFLGPIWRWHLAHTAHSAQIWRIFWPAGGPLIVWKMGPGGTPHYANPHYVKHYAIV